MAKTLSALNGYGGIYEAAIDQFGWDFYKIFIYRQGCKYVELGFIRTRGPEHGIQAVFNRHIKRHYPVEANLETFQPLTEAVDFNSLKPKAK